MKPLPKKSTPQEWVDEVLPIFDQPEPEAPKVRSKKQDADALTVKWRRRPKTAMRIPCQDCTEERAKAQRDGINMASYIRIEGTAERYLCLHHRAEHGFVEDLRKEPQNVPPPVPANRRPYRFPRRRD